jgi:hypothetical protein
MTWINFLFLDHMTVICRQTSLNQFTLLHMFDSNQDIEYMFTQLVTSRKVWTRTSTRYPIGTVDMHSIQIASRPHDLIRIIMRCRHDKDSLRDCSLNPFINLFSHYLFGVGNLRFWD